MEFKTIKHSGGLGGVTIKGSDKPDSYPNPIRGRVLTGGGLETDGSIEKN